MEGSACNDLGVASYGELDCCGEGEGERKEGRNGLEREDEKGEYREELEAATLKTPKGCIRGTTYLI